MIETVIGSVEIAARNASLVLVEVKKMETQQGVESWRCAHFVITIAKRSQCGVEKLGIAETEANARGEGSGAKQNKSRATPGVPGCRNERNYGVVGSSHTERNPISSGFSPLGPRFDLSPNRPFRRRKSIA
jgi:hypothetical protein